jgi:hypothetical protein
MKITSLLSPCPHRKIARKRYDRLVRVLQDSKPLSIVIGSFVSCCKVKALVTANFKQAKLDLAPRPHHIIPDFVVSAEHNRRPEAPGRVDGHAVDRDDRHVDHEDRGPDRKRSQCLERKQRAHSSAQALF